jgi:hypothetical protein
MRRPLNWIVVAMSLLMLVVSQMAAGPGPTSPAAAPLPPGLFAYVQEDGTEIFLPAPGPAVLPLLSFEDPPDPKAAVFTWTSPIVTAEHAAHQ